MPGFWRNLWRERSAWLRFGIYSAGFAFIFFALGIWWCLRVDEMRKRRRRDGFSRQGSDRGSPEEELGPSCRKTA